MESRSSSSYNQERQIGFWDVLIIASESWRLLVFGPLLVGLLAAGLSFFSPKTYKSIAIVKMSEDELFLIHTEPLLDALVQQLNLLENSVVSIDDARQSLKNRLSYALDAKSKTSIITATGATPEQAQQLAVAAIEQLKQCLKFINKDEIKRIEANIAANENAKNLIEDTLEVLNKNLNSTSVLEKNKEYTYKTLVLLNSELYSLTKENRQLQNQLKEHVVVQEPSLSKEGVSRLRSWIIWPSFILSGLFFFIFVFVRNELLSRWKNDLSSAKINRIKKAF